MQNNRQMVSTYHLVIWLFVLQNGMSYQLKKKILKAYGLTQNSKFKPIVTNSVQFTQVMKMIAMSKKQYVIKIIVDIKNQSQIKTSSKPINQVKEIYVYSPISIMQSRKRVVVQTEESVCDINDLEKAVQLVCDEVQNMNTFSRIFNNSQRLTGDYVSKVNKYRYRLIACIMIKISDLVNYFQHFQQFAIDELRAKNKTLKNLNQQIPSIKKQKIILVSKDINSFNKTIDYYRESALQYINQLKKFAIYKLEKQKQIRKLTEMKNKNKIISEIEEQMKEKNNQIESIKQRFYHHMISYYQGQDFFYQLINRYLKVIDKNQCDWTQMALPFSHMYQSIKQLYKKNIKTDQFYQSKFNVWRVGKIRKTQLLDYERNAQKIFIQFYGFLSTSINLSKIISTFLQQKQFEQIQDGQQQIQNCIFKIKVSHNKKCQLQKNDSLVHGFYRLGKGDSYGDIQGEVIFNALNIFKLGKVRIMKIKDLFAEQKLQSFLPDLAKNQQQAYLDENRKYEQKIAVIELQYGPFFDVIFQEDNMKLTKQILDVKIHYIKCIKKINNFDKFDFGDAYELTNQLTNARIYLQGKVNFSKIKKNTKQQNQSDKSIFLISQLDNKNYFSRLSSVYQKQGKVSLAIQFANLSIQCYKHVEVLSLAFLFQNHIKQLALMKNKLIYLYQQSQNFNAVKIQLQNKLKDLQTSDIQLQQKRIKQSQIQMCLAVNEFQVGQLNKSKMLLSTCSDKLIEVINFLSIQVGDQENICLKFIKNILYPTEGKQRKWTIKSFKEQLQREKEKKMLQTFQNKQQLNKTRILSGQLQEIVVNTLIQRQKIMQNPQQYNQMITKFKIQTDSYTISSQIIKGKQHITQQQTLQLDLKLLIKQMDKLDICSGQYKNKKAQFDSKYVQLNQLMNVRLDLSLIETDFVEKFKQKQKNRRLKKIEEQRKNAQYIHQNNLQNECIHFIEQLSESINNLIKQGYTQGSIKILQERIKLADVLQIANQYEKSMKQIQLIINSSQIQGEKRHKQLAKIFKTHGKIMLQQNNIKKAIKDFTQSIKYYQEDFKCNKHQYCIEMEKLGGQKQDNRRVHPQNIHEVSLLSNIAWRNNQYFQVKILQCKAILFLIDAKRKNETTSSNIYYRSMQGNQEDHSDYYLTKVQLKIQEINTALQKRKNIYKIPELLADFKEIQAYHMLRQPCCNKNMNIIFNLFNQSIQLRDQAVGPLNFQNALMCSELILNFYHIQSVRKNVLKFNYLNKISKIWQTSQGKNFHWKLAKAYYLMQINNDNPNKELAYGYLKAGLNNIKHFHTNDKYFKQELIYFQTQLKNYNGWMNSRIIIDNIEINESKRNINADDEQIQQIQQSKHQSKMDKKQSQCFKQLMKDDSLYQNKDQQLQDCRLKKIIQQINLDKNENNNSLVLDQQSIQKNNKLPTQENKIAQINQRLQISISQTFSFVYIDEQDFKQNQKQIYEAKDNKENQAFNQFQQEKKEKGTAYKNQNQQSQTLQKRGQQQLKNSKIKNNQKQIYFNPQKTLKSSHLSKIQQKMSRHLFDKTQTSTKSKMIKKLTNSNIQQF